MLRKLIFLLAVTLQPGVVFSAACSIDNSNRITSTSGCTADAIQRRLNIYEMGLCPTEPSPPTQTTAFDSSACSIIFRSGAKASSVTISNQGSSPLLGSKYRPDNGSYQSMYLIMSTESGIKARVTFDSVRSTDGSRTAGAYSPRETGTHCWTKDGRTYNMRTGNWASAERQTPPHIVCGDDVVGLGFSTVVQNSLDAQSAVFSQSVPTSSGLYKVHLIGYDNKLASYSGNDATGDVGKVLVYVPQNITVSDSANGMKISFRLLDATNVDQLSYSGTNYLYDLAGSGNIEIMIQITEANWESKF